MNKNLAVWWFFIQSSGNRTISASCASGKSGTKHPGPKTGWWANWPKAVEPWKSLELTCTGGLFQWGNHWFGSFGVILETLSWRSRQSINAGFSIASFEYRTGGFLDVSCLMPSWNHPLPQGTLLLALSLKAGMDGNGWKWIHCWEDLISISLIIDKM